LDLASARRALSSLTAAGLISYTPARRTRGVHLLDERPAEHLRIRPQELARRAALEQRKLREMISFCYADRCYRAFILDYFGDRSHPPQCGTCGNCAGEAQSARATEETRDDSIFSTANEERAKSAAASFIPLDPATELDRFVVKHAPVALDLEEELSARTRQRRTREAAEASAPVRGGADWDDDGQDAIEDAGHGISVTQARELTADEALRARKILACAARMGGRFGKGLLAACLRGSRSAKIAQAGLDQLSTYGLLDDMTQDEILLCIDALVAAGCLPVTGGVYPTVALTPFGGDVMRERAAVRLALPEAEKSALPPRRADAPAETTALSAAPQATAKRASTVDETYELYCAGLSIEEIGERRGLTEITIEKHLADCIAEGRPFDLSRHVPAADRELIEVAVDQLGTERLKPLREALPARISYRMIRFVVADLQREGRHAASAEEQE
ncbi:MAG: helix-turn-helix domain-containing protein, partial [Acidobacteria bacterium]|nr:helix-turn-helix domain-containing protein [Acidobacteriota bacterium]